MRHVTTLAILSCISLAGMGCFTAHADQLRQPQEAEPAASSTLGLYGHVSARVLNDVLQRDINRKENVAETILNMTTRGQAQVDCRINLELVPNSQAANVRFRMNGHAIVGNTVGTTRAVQVHSSSRTSIAGHKDITIDARGLTLTPAQANCRTSLQVNRIDAPNELIERLAWRRVGRLQGEAEQAASALAARRAEQQVEAEFNPTLRQVQDKYRENIYDSLVRKDALPFIRLATTSEHLSIGLASRANPAAMPTPDFMLAYDLALCLREDFAGNLIGKLIGGKMITDREFADWMQTLTGTTPRALWVHSRAQPWSVTLDKDNPLSLRFDNNEVHIAVRIERADRGAKSLDRPLVATANFSLAITHDGPRLRRLGDVETVFRNVDSQSAAETDAEIEFRRFLRRKLSGIFPEELYFDGLVPPAGGFWGRLRKLKPVQLTTQNGWLALGYEWRRDPPNAIAISGR